MVRYGWTCLAVAIGASSCTNGPPLDPERALIEKGRRLFLTETFDGNGRTCGTCHPPQNNFTLDPAFIATLPDDDPLFVAEFNPELRENFENPRLMRQFGLIVENLDGFDDLENRFVMRGIPHTLGLRHSVDSREGPRTGWSGDGAPGDGSLRSFAVGAVIQHFTKTLNRVAGEDFRLPSDDELDALEAFQLSLGRQEELNLPLPLRNPTALRGQEIFNDPTTGKCFACHFNAGANGDPAVFGEGVGNLNFNTGVEALPDQPPDLIGEKMPPDDGFGIPGDSTFNTPSLIEAADTGPFFHNNSVATLEGAVAFYNGEAFNNSPAGQLVKQATGSGINLDATQVEAVAAFLRVINVLDNLRESLQLTRNSLDYGLFNRGPARRLLAQAGFEIDDAIEVLQAGGLHPEAIPSLSQARALVQRAHNSLFSRKSLTRKAIAHLEQARGRLIDMQQLELKTEK